MYIKIGQGYDVHRLIEGAGLRLGGVDIPYTKKILGHSDGDVLLHAVMDALLGAAGLGDIGQHFPDNDPGLKGVNSMDLLAKTAKIIQTAGYAVGNIDATLIAQSPRLSPYRDQMRQNIALVLGIKPMDVNIKYTTEEGLGFTGTGEGIAAQAVCLLQSQKRQIVPI